MAHPGGFAEYLLYCEHAVHHLPEGVSLEEEALTDTPAVGVTALNRIRMHLSGSVLIIGTRPIGWTTMFTIGWPMREGRRRSGGLCGSRPASDRRSMVVCHIMICFRVCRFPAARPESTSLFPPESSIML